MGCDIHTVAQIKKYDWSDNWYTTLLDVAGEDRDYNSFAVMANVRNGHGFAGVPTGEGWKPLSKPKGIPADYKFNVYGDDEGQDHDVWLGDHSYSWFTLSEIKNYWNTNYRGKSYERCGVVTKNEYIKMKEESRSPNEWSGDVCGQNIVKVAEKVFDIANNDCTHVKIKWNMPTEKCCFYLMAVIKELEFLAKSREVLEESIRLVFGFDS